MASLYRVRYQVKITASNDTAEKLIAFQRADETTTQLIDATLKEGHAETRAVVAGATDEALAFGGVATAKFLYLETDTELTFKLNGGTESFKLGLHGGTMGKLAWSGEFTAITVSNAGTEDACLTYVLAG